MPLQLMRFQVALQDDSMLAKDQYVNTFHIANLDGTGTISFAPVAAALTTFYNNFKAYLSPTIATADGTIKMYNVNAEKETPPVDQEALVFATEPGTLGAALPYEVASCLTYHSFPQTGAVKRQSWRGRIYIGPLNVGTVDSTRSGRPSPAFLTGVTNFAKTLAESIHAAGYHWVIASKVQQRLYPVINFYMDDAWDTQRSRGNRPTMNTKTTPALTFPTADTTGTAHTWT
jgi:hypothetical protein